MKTSDKKWDDRESLEVPDGFVRIAFEHQVEQGDVVAGLAAGGDDAGQAQG
ncbi:MAG: hypothetical protein ABSC05_24325 [Candidatus Solibacter sp.]|jgi:hypothetical protein